MSEQNKNYIVQYVGFKTTLNETDFIKRWTPFATNFKNAGIKSIDLYQVNENENITYISRNIWDAKTYFENFPTGVAGSGSGGGISVTQFGGYFIDDSDLNKSQTMQLLFTNQETLISLPHKQRNQCTQKVKFIKSIEYLEVEKTLLPKETLSCNHLKTM
jgi:hypothetical protein